MLNRRQIRSFGQINTFFFQLILNVRVQYQGFGEFVFHGVHFNHDSQISFSSTSQFMEPKNG